MDKTLVIAKYKEDTSWVNKIDLSWDIVIYDKDKDMVNIGRESHTFLYHICLNYHNLSDITIFTQGKPFDHCGSFINKVNKGVFIEGYTPLSDRIIHIPEGKRTFYSKPELISECQAKFGLPIRTAVFPYGALMAVKKERILKRPLSDYLKYLTLVSNSEQNTHELEYLWPQIFGEDK